MIEIRRFPLPFGIARWSLGALLLMVCGLTQAQPQYRVDAIIFLDRHASTEGGQPLPGRPLLRSLAAEDTEGLQQVGITMLPEGDFALTQQWNRLRNAQRYQPLVRLSWTQTAPPEANGPRIRVESGAIVTAGEDGRSDVRALSGSVALEMGRFLHLDADLRYVSSESGQPRIYPLRERRRVRRDELHYLDSPRIGMLAKVTRIDN